jgi:hypothetical protein
MPLRNRPARGEPVEEPDVVGLGVEDIGDSPMPLPEPAGQIGIDPIPMPEPAGQIGIDPIPMPEPAGVVGIDPDPAFLPSEPFQVEGEELTYVGDTTPLVPPPDREMENPWHPEDEDVQR